MDEESTGDYSEPCGQCGSVCWSVSDGGHFFCKNCHNVIERTQHIAEEDAFYVNNRISSIPSGFRKRGKQEGGREWLVCEGFQFILKHQAEALVALGVNEQLKTNVLGDLWKRYLQKTRQAYTKDPLKTNRDLVALTSESEADEGTWENDAASAASGYSTDGKSSVCSGSLDAEFYFNPTERRKQYLMSMPRTLALCHLALLWLREAITLADLLRLVSKGHVPYVNAHEILPEEIRFFGRDALIFRAESIPSYRKVQEEALKLAELMELPKFPPVSQDCLLHPTLLSLRYLLDANLPNELHLLVCNVIQKTAMGSDLFLTFDPAGRKCRLRHYDLQAAALIIVTMKLLFRLDDQTEWKLSKKANENKKAQEGKDQKRGRKKKMTKQGSKMFSLRTWYMAVQPALERAMTREEQEEAKREWKSKTPIIPFPKRKTVVLKRRRVVEQLQNIFQNLVGSTPEQQPPSPSSFVFRWGKVEGADGPSLHGQRVLFLLEKQAKGHLPINHKYWHTALRPCRPQECGDHFPELEPTLPRTYMWVLGLFSFLLGVKKALLHNEVVQVERRLLSKKKLEQDTSRPQRKRRRRAV